MNTQSTPDQDIRDEQIELLYSQSIVLNLANIPVAFLTFLVLKSSIPSVFLISWLVLISTFSALRIVPVLLYKNSSNKRTAYWKWVYILFTFTAGWLWGVLGLLLTFDISDFQQNYIILLLLGISATSIAANQAYLPSFYTFVIPILLPISTVFINSSIDKQYNLSILIVFYLVVLAKAASIAAGNIRQTIELRIQNKQLIDELSNSNTELKNEVQVRELAQHRLLLAKNTAEQANRAKTEFLSRMSHEFRTPLTSIIGFSQLMRHNTTLPEKFVPQAASIHNAGQYLLSLVNDLLDLASIDAGKIEIKYEDFELSQIIEQCIELSQELINKYQIQVINKIPVNSNYFIHADLTRTKQVLLNLITNAIKYNKKNGHVVIQAEPVSGDRISIQIIDNGAGISEENMKNIFLPFERLGAENTAIQGVGIGLSITKYLIEKMNGVLEVESQPGMGSTFSVTLNLSKI